MKQSMKQLKAMVTDEQYEVFIRMYPDALTAADAVRQCIEDRARSLGLEYPHYDFAPGLGGKRPGSGRKRKQPQNLGG